MRVRMISVFAALAGVIAALAAPACGGGDGDGEVKGETKGKRAQVSISFKASAQTVDITMGPNGFPLGVDQVTVQALASDGATDSRVLHSAEQQAVFILEPGLTTFEGTAASAAGEVLFVGSTEAVLVGGNNTDVNLTLAPAGETGEGLDGGSAVPPETGADGGTGEPSAGEDAGVPVPPGEDDAGTPTASGDGGPGPEVLDGGSAT